MFAPQHFGLYFSPAQLDDANTQRSVEPWRSAWDWLDTHPQVDLIAIAQHSSLRYRLLGDLESGQRAIQILVQDAFQQAAPDSITQIATLMSYAQCFEMLRDHPDFTQQGECLDAFVEQVNALVEQESGYVLGLWRNSLRLVAAVVLEDEGQFTQAVERFVQVVQTDIHPEGYIRKAIDDTEGGGSFYRMLWAMQALILCAEAASHAGQDLWTVNQRGVSILTPLPYLLYYYYLPEKWRWDAPNRKAGMVPEEGQSSLSEIEVQRFVRQHGGIWEMAQRRQYLPDRQDLLDTLRPVFDPLGGGLVTLTHAALMRRQKRFGIF